MARFTATRARLAEVLNRRLVRARLAGVAFDEDAAGAAIASIVQEFAEKGWVDDHAAGLARARTLVQRGKADRAIRADLKARGLDDEAIARTMAEIAPADDPEAEARRAARLIRRRKLGPYRADTRRRDGDGTRDLGVLARAGFAPEVARRLLTMSPGELDELIDG